MKNSVIYTVGDILPKILFFFMIPIYTKYMSVQEYGIVNSVLSVGSIVSMFYTLGLDGALMRFYYEYEEEKREIFISTLWIFLFIYTIGITLILLALGSNFSSIIFKSIPFKPFVRLMILNCFFYTFTALPLIIFRAREEAMKFGFFSVVSSVINVLFIVYFVIFLKQGAEGNLKAYTITNLIFSIIYLIMIKKGIKLRFSCHMLKEALKYGIPLIPHLIGSWVINASDRMFLERYRTLTEVGLYSLGYQFGLVLEYVLGGINKAYVPFFFKTANENKNAPKIFEDIIKYYSIFILSLGLSIAMFSKELIMLLASNKNYLEAYKIIPFITVVSILNGYYYMSVNSIFYVRKTKTLAVTTAVAAIINAALNIILVPKYGMQGAVFTTIISYAYMCVCVYHKGQKCYVIKWHWKDIIKNITICLFIYICSTVSISNKIIFSIMFKLMLYTVYIILLFLLKILSLTKIKEYKDILIKRFKH